MRRILVRLSGLPGVAIFRNQSGMAWQGEVVREDHVRGLLTLRNYRPIRFGVGPGGKDGADTLGWMSTVITPEMVGRRVAVFIAAEVKTERGRATPGQRRFIEAVRNAGGIGVIAHSEEEAAAAVKGGIR